MTRTTTLTVAPDDVRVVLPDAINLITPYVLYEQRDWFEDEIKFLRRLLQPGEQVIDIGANYGVYALSMARTVGPRGAIFAFEPAASTADLLQQSIAANQFSQIVLERAALSETPGTARLATSEHAELNALAHGAAASGAGESVRVDTLDAAQRRHAWTDIAFVKMDAEGEEARILRGGRDFFARTSPLVMYEVRADNVLNLDLVREFEAIGYTSYRLVPGLGILAPFDPAPPVDAFVLNLFCCKPDRAASLAQRGLLVERPEAHPAATAARMREQFAAWPYAASLALRWRDAADRVLRAEVEGALGDYFASREPALGAAQRHGALRRAFQRFDRLCAAHPSVALRASLARIGAELGARSRAIDTLSRLHAACAPGQPAADLAEPFLAVTPRYESLETGGDVHRWMQASILEGYERLSAYSSYFSGREALVRLEALAALGFADEEMQRRLQLVRLKFPGAGAA